MEKRVLIINPSPIYVKNTFLLKLFREVSKKVNHVDLLSYYVIKNIDLSELTKHYTHVIISGSAGIDIPSIDKRTNVKEHYAWIKKLDIPLLGICAGHQILAYIHGAKILHEKEIEKSPKLQLEKCVDHPLLKGIGKKFTMFELHRDSVQLPKNFTNLATSPTCKNQIIAHNKKPLFGSQAHPERSGRNGTKLLNNFLKF